MSNKGAVNYWAQPLGLDPLRYECDRASLPMGNLTDGEVAAGVIAYSGIAAFQLAAGERIRWLSYQLERVAPLVEACEFLGKANRAKNGGPTGAFRDGINMVIEEEQKLSGLPFEERDDE